MRPDPRYDEPFSWWGPAGRPAANPSVRDLVRDGTIDLWGGSALWAALARRRSLIVVAGPSGVGKTALLTALLELLPPDTRRIYPRGCFETFAFLADAQIVPEQTALVINEISPHLPVYLWGPAVARVLDAAQLGFALLATAHAESVPQFVGTLTGSPLRIPARRVAAFEFVVEMGWSEQTRGGRAIHGISRLSTTRDGVEIESLQSPLHDISQETNPSLQQYAAWFPIQELLERYRILEALRDGQIENLPGDRAFHAP